MENFTPISALIGGGLIGASAVFLMWSLGRIAGISGIVGGVFGRDGLSEGGWRIAFIAGLIASGIAALFIWPSMMQPVFPVQGWLLLVAGLLVGMGTQLGSGCTSGHGVCGISRLSVRSIIATLVFMATGIITVLIVRELGMAAL